MLVVAVQQHRKHSKAEWESYEQSPAIGPDDQGSHEHEPETQNGRDHNRKRSAADFGVRDEAIDSMWSRPRRTFRFLGTFMRRQRAKNEKKQQINKRNEEKDHKPNRLARVAKPLYCHRYANPDKRYRGQQ
jgi:hypothetical protein